MSRAFLVAARRTAVAPRNGAFRRIEAWELAAPTLLAAAADANCPLDAIDDVLLGSALYGGGNPARMASLAAGLPDSVPALTVDTQCCAGLDAILLAAARVRAGEARAILAGGLESYSRAPLRARRPFGDEPPEPYDRPPFAPWPARDPDPLSAAAGLAPARGYARADQEAYAIASHAKALAAVHPEIVDVAGVTRDAFARRLDAAVCRRARPVAGDGAHAVTAATVAVEADAAAAALVVSEEMAERLGAPLAVEIVAGLRLGGDPAQPGLSAGRAAAGLLAREGRPRIACAEIMESFAAQAIAAIADAGLDPEVVNRGGGALSRGHPIGASGAILVARLFHELAREPAGARGLAAIAAVGGLGAAALFRRA
ncbi:MAG TPA: beta-ketoacyl synthase N-terminal-like domain-containing protein [Beijerinckiaceae bacterium]